MSICPDCHHQHASFQRPGKRSLEVHICVLAFGLIHFLLATYPGLFAALQPSLRGIHSRGAEMGIFWAGFAFA